MIQGYILDLDGTLLDSMHVWDTLGEQVLSLYGIETKENLKEVCASMSLEESARYLKQNYHINNEVAKLMEQMNACIAHQYVHELPLKDGVKEFIDLCYEKKIKLCVLTASDATLANAALLRCGILDKMSFVMTCSEEKLSKSNPQIFDRALKKLGIEKAQCAVVEDALHAIACAKDAGYRVFAVYEQANEKDWPMICAICDQAYETIRDMEMVK